MRNVTSTDGSSKPYTMYKSVIVLAENVTLAILAVFVTGTAGPEPVARCATSKLVTRLPALVSGMSPTLKPFTGTPATLSSCAPSANTVEARDLPLNAATPTNSCTVDGSASPSMPRTPKSPRTSTGSEKCSATPTKLTKSILKSLLLPFTAVNSSSVVPPSPDSASCPCFKPSSARPTAYSSYVTSTFDESSK